MRPHYLISLDLTGRRILIVGAGPVAIRKARGVLDAGADDVTMVAPRLPSDLPAGLRAIERPFAGADLDGMDMCFVATNDPAVNAEIVKLCRERRILCNRADRDESARATLRCRRFIVMARSRLRYRHRAHLGWRRPFATASRKSWIPPGPPWVRQPSDCASAL